MLISTILPGARIQPATRTRDSRPGAHFQTPRTSPPNPAHRRANTTKITAKAPPSASIQPHHLPNSLLELAETSGNEREIDFSVPPSRNYKGYVWICHPVLRQVYGLMVYVYPEHVEG